MTTLYTVPGATSAICNSVLVCNQGVAGSFRISLQLAAAADTPKQYWFYDQAIAANQTVDLTAGMGMATTDVVKVYASHGNMSFNASILQLT